MCQLIEGCQRGHGASSMITVQRGLVDHILSYSLCWIDGSPVAVIWLADKNVGAFDHEVRSA